MNARELFRPKRPFWLAISGALLVVCLATFAIVKWWKGWSPGSVWGLTFGAWHGVAALLYGGACVAALLVIWNDDFR